MRGTNDKFGPLSYTSHQLITNACRIRAF